MSQTLPAGLPTLSQYTPRVRASISFSIASARSDAAKRTVMPWFASRCANSVCVVPYSCGTETMLLPGSVRFATA